ncbi:GD20765 [Drosophila simulans]|uniref:GD20765 n=1 Tax=Drosophila simulans TaxID=7240 RepID=B4QVZ4_DROSI|nr:GD20765 [Drosophila simulans]
MRRLKIVAILFCILCLSVDRRAYACHCIRLGKCAPFARLLLHHGPGEQSAVFAKVHSASCGFQGLEPLVCCPTSRKQNHDESSSVKASRKMRFASPNDRWIWDDGDSDKGSRHTHGDYLEAETNLHDYWNFEEQRNCPPPVEPEFFDRRFGLGHHFLYHVEHEERDTLLRPLPKDKPIVFPGDLRFLRQGEEAIDSNIDQGPPLAPFTTTLATPIETVPASSSTTTTLMPPFTQENTQGCGINVESRLLGGEQASAGQFPWLTRIAYRNRRVRFIRLPIVNTTSCAIAYASLSENFQQPIVITPNHLCAQGMPMKDVCRGDSGGPLMDNGTSGVFGTRGR